MASRHSKQKQKFEDLSSYSSTKEYKKNRRGSRARLAAKIFAGVLSGLLILVGGGSMYVATHLIGDLTTTNITKDPTALGIDPSVEMDDSIKNIALFGLDSRSDGTEGDSSNSDVIMVLTVDNKHKKLKLTSILRDSYVSIEGETSSGEHVDYMDKINAAYSVGGYELAIRTLNRNFGLNIMDYVTIDFTDTAAIVDAFGGVEISLTAEEKWEINQNLWNLKVDVEREKERDLENDYYAAQLEGDYDTMEAIENGTYVNPRSYTEILDSDFLEDANGQVVDLAGAEYSDSVELLNGNQAVAYGRIRHIGNDYQRVERQQIVFKALVSRVTELSFGEYPSLIAQLMPYCETSLDLTDVVGMTPILASDFTIETISIPDVDYEFDLSDDGAYLNYDVERAGHRIDSFINEEDSAYWSEFGNSGATPAEGTAEQEARDNASSHAGNSYTGSSNYGDDSSDSSGYGDGYSDSYDSGYGDSYSDSYDSGYGDGYTDSYDSGYGDGYTDSYDSGYGDSYSDSYDSGYGDSYSDSYDSGYGDSYSDSYDSGYGDGYNDSYDSGTGDGYNDSYDSGYSDGTGYGTY